MINILLPMGGKSQFFNLSEYPFPLPLIEIFEKTIIQMVIENLNSIGEKIRFIFVVNENDCTKYHLDNVLNLLTSNNSAIIKLKNETKGAACSALFAIEHINNNQPLIITNSDQVIDVNLSNIIDYFMKKEADAGVICFESIHPRWSYIRLNCDGTVCETAEKRPLSKNAIAGFYYFRQGKFFVDAAMESIRKDAHLDGIFYIAPTINELILRNMKVLFYKIDNAKYHTFYSPQKIKEYEQKSAEC
jgi:dTDP-glucose pyrophosphorylase